MRKCQFIAFCLGGFLPAPHIFAATYISLGYGLQMNSMLNAKLKSNLQNLILNQSANPLVGTSGLSAYNSNWSMSTPSPDGTSPYAFIGLPELRAASDWDFPQLQGRIGIFGSISGFLPQTNSYFKGTHTITEANTCPSVDYSKCPLAATNFVNTSGTATYDAEIRSSLRFYNLNVGLTYARKILALGAGELTVGGELGLNYQSFAVTTQFVAARCSNGASIPCASISQARVFQGELRSQSVFALGPVVGGTVRYDRTASFWFAELGLSVAFLITKIENSGYSDFVAANTVAFSQTSVAAGVPATQSVFALLPAAIVRFGVRL